MEGIQGIPEDELRQLDNFSDEDDHADNNGTITPRHMASILAQTGLVLSVHIDVCLELRYIRAYPD